MKLRKDFVVLPTLRSNDDQSLEKHSDWLELLYDLIFVAAISQIALNLSANYTPITFLESIPLFFAIWWGWSGHTFYLDRFGTDDILNRALTMLQMVVVASLAVNVRNALTTTGEGFAISYAVLRFILVAQYIMGWKKFTGCTSINPPLQYWFWYCSNYMVDICIYTCSLSFCALGSCVVC